MHDLGAVLVAERLGNAVRPESADGGDVIIGVVRDATCDGVSADLDDVHGIPALERTLDGLYSGWQQARMPLP